LIYSTTGGRRHVPGEEKMCTRKVMQGSSCRLSRINVTMPLRRRLLCHRRGACHRRWLDGNLS
jgi:hypothetical protein